MAMFSASNVVLLLSLIIFTGSHGKTTANNGDVDDCSLIDQAKKLPHAKLNALYRLKYAVDVSFIKSRAAVAYNQTIEEVLISLPLLEEQEVLFIRYGLTDDPEILIGSIHGGRYMWPIIHNSLINSTSLTGVIILMKDGGDFTVTYTSATVPGYSWWNSSMSEEYYMKHQDSLRKRCGHKVPSLFDKAIGFVSSESVPLMVLSLESLTYKYGTRCFFPANFMQVLFSIKVVLNAFALIVGGKMGAYLGSMPLTHLDLTTLRYLCDLSSSQFYFSDPLDVAGGRIALLDLLMVATEHCSVHVMRELVRRVQPELRPKLLKSMTKIRTSFSLVPAILSMTCDYRVNCFVTWAFRIPPDSYLLTSKPVLLAICCQENREDAELELESLLRLSDIFNIHMLVDPTEDEVMENIRDLQLHSELSALAVVVMAHGTKGYFRVRDRCISIRDLIMQMSPPIMAGIPKMVIIQACQSNNREPTYNVPHSMDPQPPAQQHGLNTESGYSATASDELIGSELSIRSRDVVVVMATVAGSDAVRNLFIPLLVEQIEKGAETETIEQIFYRTNAEMKKRAPGQVPIIHSTLTKTLCLKTAFTDIEL